MKREDNLIVLKGVKPIEYANETFYPNKYYNVITLEEKPFKQHLVKGKIFQDDKFNENFEDATKRVLRDWEMVGLRDLDTGKPITKTAFNKLADVHVYTGYSGGRRTRIRIIYFRNSKNCIYGFYVYNSTKAKDLKDAYEMYIETFNGSTEYLDSQEIQFGNRGIPIAYGDLGVWKETPKPFIL